MGDRIEKKYKKRNSAKRHSAKKHSLKKSSLKKSSLKKSSLKKSSLKKSSLKKSSLKKSSLKKTKPSKIRSEYNMKGMGILLNMYGGAISDLENDLEKLKLQLKKHIRKYKSEKDLNEKKKLKTIIKSMKMEVSEKSDKINDLLEGITDTASKAYGNTKTIKGGDVASKISSFLSKKIGETISEGKEKLSESKEKLSRSKIGSILTNIFDKTDPKSQKFSDNECKHTMNEYNSQCDGSQECYDFFGKSVKGILNANELNEFQKKCPECKKMLDNEGDKCKIQLGKCNTKFDEYMNKCGKCYKLLENRNSSPQAMEEFEKQCPGCNKMWNDATNVCIVNN